MVVAQPVGVAVEAEHDRAMQEWSTVRRRSAGIKLTCLASALKHDQPAVWSTLTPEVDAC